MWLWQQVGRSTPVFPLHRLTALFARDLPGRALTDKARQVLNFLVKILIAINKEKDIMTLPDLVSFPDKETVTTPQGVKNYGNLVFAGKKILMDKKVIP